MAIDERIEKALRTGEPLSALRTIAQMLIEQGSSEAAVTALFDHARLQLRADGREPDEDIVTDAMDFIVGWCSPHMKLQQK